MTIMEIDNAPDFIKDALRDRLDGTKQKPRNLKKEAATLERLHIAMTVHPHEFESGDLVMLKPEALGPARLRHLMGVFMEYIPPIHGVQLMRKPVDLDHGSAADLVDCKATFIAPCPTHGYHASSFLIDARYLQPFDLNVMQALIERHDARRDDPN